MPKQAKRKIELLAGIPAQGESLSAIVACNDYLRMGAGRTMAKLAGQYQVTALRGESAPTAKYGTLRTWSQRYGWAARAEEYDGAIELEKNRALSEKRAAIMEEGVALDFERVKKLKAVEADLYDQYFETDDDGHRVNLWVKDVKQIGSGEDAERVDIVRFNAALVEQWRGVNDDIAKEKGERKLRVESQSLAVSITAEDLSSAQIAMHKWEQEHKPGLPPPIVDDEDGEV